MTDRKEPVITPVTAIIVAVLMSCICTVVLIDYLEPEPDRIAVLNLRVGLSGEQGEELFNRAQDLAKAGYVVINANQLAAWPAELELLPIPEGKASK